MSILVPLRLFRLLGLRTASIHEALNSPSTPPRSPTTVVEVDISDAGVSADKQIATRVRDVEPVKVLPDILAFLQKETELTRHTLAEILKKSGRLGEFKINPQAFMAAVAKQISRALHDLMLEGIKYEKVAGQYWEQSRIGRCNNPMYSPL
jgi:type III restriction enzyme